MTAVGQAGVAPGDDENLRRKKSLLTFGVMLKILACPIWAIAYGLEGFYLAALIPLAYMALTVLSTSLFIHNKAFPSYATRQIVLMLALPAGMQYALGGFVPASGVILWSLLAPLMAFLFHGARRAVLWIVAFMLLAAGSGILELAGIPAPAAVPLGLRYGFFVMNTCVVGLVVCATVRYFAVRLEAEQARSEALLTNMLPSSIAERLKRGEETIADSYEQVTVLFADVVGFTGLSTRVSPTEMVHLLNRMFSAFDTLAVRHGLEKIKTIGDGYHAVAGLPEARADHAHAAAAMALEMQEAVKTLATEFGSPIALRVGIASGGPIIAGVIGTQKYTYEVWGDVVNLAQRMESHSLPGAVQVTEAVYEQLRGEFDFEPRGAIQVKGLGPMPAYLLTGRSEGTAPVPQTAVAS